MNAKRIVSRLLEASGSEHSRYGRWWNIGDEDDLTPEQEAERFKQDQARRREQSKMQTVANTIRNFEPNSRDLLDQVIGRDALLKERSSRLDLEAELGKHGLTVANVQDYIFKERDTRDGFLKSLHTGQADDNRVRCPACPHDFSNVQTGDMLGVKTDSGNIVYFSKPLRGLPSKIANPNA